MAAEALIVEDAYQRGYADAIADMRKKKEQRRQREQAKKARRWYFIKQKAYGLAMLAVTVLAVWATEGDIKVFPLDDSGNYAELASYLIKYTGTHKKGTDGALQGKRWNCSKNLVRPEPEYHIISDREYFKKEPKAIKGYYVDKNSVSMGVHSPEYYGYGYLRYTLVKITDKGG